MSEQLVIPNYVTIVSLQETTDEGSCYVAYHPELPNTVSQGDTPEEATENLIEATQMTIEYLTEKGLPIPQPGSLQSPFGNLPGSDQPVAKSVSATSFRPKKNNPQPTLVPSGQLVPA